ncbi:phage major capsid protein [uncultured Sphingomonas sp.]|uniref:phage major capsid protein n=1 Tax=uncultured Sphingomonas sp. TaxID=158754 RepID=UPI0025934AD0|nr:phage major capsid protein [uncultured Sphingomonas sp.]
MKMHSRSALAAVATVFAHPFRALKARKSPLTLTAPVLDMGDFEVDPAPARKGFVEITVPPTPRALVSPVFAEAPTDPKALFAGLNTAFEEFKATHAAQIEEIKAGKTDVVTTDKLAKINESLADLEKAINDQALAAATAQTHGGRKVQDQGYFDLYGSYLRDGSREQEEKVKSQQFAGPRAAMSVGSTADGGLTAPIEWDRTITERLKLISPLRAEATVQSISKAGFIKLFTDRQLGSGWVGETASRPATSTPSFTALPFVPGELYANAAASQDLLDDSEIDMESWLTGEIETEFSRQEGIAFVAGDGSNKPYGILAYVTGGSAAARHPWGAILTRNSGLAADLTADQVSNIVYDLPAMYSPNAKWFMNRKTMGKVRLLQDSQKRYLWQPSYQVGQPSTLLGASIVDVPDMPDVAAGNVPILFGDMKETYLVIDRIGFRVLRDPYTNKPFISFYCTKRVGGGVKNPDAMKALVISATANP